MRTFWKARMFTKAARIATKNRKKKLVMAGS